MPQADSPNLENIAPNTWRIARFGNMNGDAVIYADPSMLAHIRSDQCLSQVVNVACLPGLVGNALAMPDIHWGYGFPIGGVAAFDFDDGIISPGGVGYDINCGVRLYSTSLPRQAIARDIPALVDALFMNIPSGIGSRRKDRKLTAADYRGVLTRGAAWAVAQGYGEQPELQHIEDAGCIAGADPALISNKAFERGRSQLGTLGSGNHFVEIACVDTIYDAPAAAQLGLTLDAVTISVHTGSRGFGYQVCDETIKKMLTASRSYDIPLPDRQLCCAPLRSPEGQSYLAAMACAANYAFVNRHLIGHWIKQTFEQVLDAAPRELGFGLVYDVCHNIAKIETHTIGRETKKVCVHRKGATRAFAPHHPLVPDDYRHIGQPVLIPGDMGRCSYVLVGTEQAMQQTFGSSCHGAGRRLSRNQAKKAARGRCIADELSRNNIHVRAAGRSTLSEEMPEAYKDVNQVVDVIDTAGLGKKVVRLRPLGVIKG
ncbi:MAG: RtcB family protein [Deltaproteobacteria bacterium]|nr:RtcB family protein [Deltaproteobacteria bacterium]